jgi:hypothetical protein
MKGTTPNKNVPARSPTGMPRFERVIRESRTFACSLPAAAFGLLRINAPRLACLSLLIGADPSRWPFARPQRLPPFRGTSAVRSPFPACRFRTVPNHLRTRSVSDSLPRLGFCSHGGAAQRPPPVVRILTRHSQPILKPSLPFGIFAPQARSAQLDSESRNSPLRIARSPFAPRPRCLF